MSPTIVLSPLKTMRLATRGLRLIGLTVALIAGATPSVAQVPSSGDTSVGYEALGVTGEGGEVLKKGWYVDAAARLTAWLDLAIDIGGAYPWTLADNAGSAWRFGLGAAVAF